MNYFIRKLWLSVIVGLLILVTAITSTYAWYAMTFTNDIDEFNFNIVGGNSLYISTNGIDFGSSISTLQVKKAVLEKKGIDTSQLSEKEINNQFNLVLTPVTPKNYEKLDDGFNEFDVKGDFRTSDKYLSFDIYMTCNSISNETDGTSVSFASNDVISSTLESVSTKDTEISFHQKFGNLPSEFFIDLKNACRLGIISYDVTDINDITNSSNNPKSTIYDFGGNQVNVTSNVYNFGGIHTYPNYAVDVYNKHADKKIVAPYDGREDIYFDKNEIISRDEKLDQSKMKKFTIYFWLEGWDADCIAQLAFKYFSFTLSLKSN